MIQSSNLFFFFKQYASALCIPGKNFKVSILVELRCITITSHTHKKNKYVIHSLDMPTHGMLLKDAKKDENGKTTHAQA